MPTSTIAISNGSYDGHITSTALGFDTTTITMGISGSSVYRGLLSFDVSSIPAGAQCLAATLYLQKTGNFGTHTVTVRVLDADWIASTATRLAAYSASYAASTSFTTGPAGQNSVALPTAAVAAKFGSRLPIRLENDGVPAYGHFYTIEYSSGLYAPYVSITYAASVSSTVTADSNVFTRENTLPRLTVLATPDTVSDYFTAAITSPKQVPLARVEVLDPTTLAVKATVTDDVDDGSVTVDVSRGNRRTFQLRLVNKDGKYTPVADGSDTQTYFAFNSMIRLYRGFRYTDSRGGETDEYCLLGTFYIDRPEVFVERNMSVLTVDGSDRWKQLAMGGFSSNQTFATGTLVNTLIYEIGRDCGIEQYGMNLDPLADRDVALTKLGTKLQWEIGDNRAEFLKNLCDQFGLEVFFDVAGLLTTRPVVDPTTVSPKWTFTPSDDGVMLGVTKIQSDLNLFNDIIVSGETSQGVFTGARAEKADTDPTSPTYIYGTLGRRVFHYKAPLVYGNDQALVVATKLFYEKCLIEEEIKLPTVCLPHLDGNDVIAISEGTWSKVDDRYLAQRFDIPLREARQVIETKKGRAIL